VKLGLIPGWGGTQRLPRVVGMSEASEMLASARTHNGAMALTLRLADAVVASERLHDKAAATTAGADAARAVRAKKLHPLPAIEQQSTTTGATGSTAAREAVRVLTEGAGLPLYEAIRLETEAFMRLAGSDESKRLIAEFFASRKK
jgi:enoyl-CoA hydratase/carnithine racemase